MKPSIPKGTRDFSPAEVAKRQYIIQKMRAHFEKFGFQPIETPSFENSETLMGKYGEEGDRLIFKILNSGEYISKFNETLVDFIRFSVIYHKDYLKKANEFFDLKDYDLLYKKNLSLHLKSKNLFIFKDGTISEIELLDDVFYLIIKKLNNDDLLSKSDSQLDDFVKSIFADFYYGIKYKHLTGYISEKALRYDLTVPFARYVVQHQNDIEFPFKRYQIQPVWRADRPQKGRFREFYQCDADVVGSTSLWQEVELVQLYDSIFTDLGLNGVTIKINNRKILSGIAEVIGASDKLIDFTVALDKLDKIGEDGVKKEMIEKGISETAIEKVQPLFNFTGSISEKITKLSVLLTDSIEGMKGVEELQFICDNVSDLGLTSAILDLDVTLARGLNYYTGAIFEVAPPKAVSMGSIGGGGRYDDLTGIFGLKNMSGVGISFGLDRIYLVIEELGLFPETVTTTSKAIFLNFGQEETKYSMKAITELRKSGVKIELYPDNVKIAKQFQYAEKRGIPLAIIVGDDEMKNNQFSVKNLVSGEQQKLSFEELKKLLQ
ncbi:MAG: histidine--tRNA ligase [Flavobacterium sp.]|uniref:histidine--tRNA ligase n=1 Tax=Flavobacterium sp. TaxID=239 RepID=UPI0032663033